MLWKLCGKCESMYALMCTCTRRDHRSHLQNDRQLYSLMNGAVSRGKVSSSQSHPQNDVNL